MHASFHRARLVATAAGLSAAAVLAQGLALPAPQAAAVSAYSWLQFNGDPAHTGNNTAEGRINVGNVHTLTQSYRVALGGVVDGAPAYVSGVPTASGTKNVLYMTTKDGQILARDAATGANIWSQTNGPGGCTINGGANPCYTTSSPAVDATSGRVFSYGLDGKVHAYALGTGAEVLGGGWPETATLKGFDEKGSPALSLATDTVGNRYIYVANGGYPGDGGDYQGHITAINLATGTQKVFNTLCSDQAVHFVHSPASPDCPKVQSAVWARPGVVYSAATNKIYIGTGNGLYDPANHHWGDSVLALNPDGSGVAGDPVDAYTPTNQSALNTNDEDLGSTAPAPLPAIAHSSVAHVAVQGGKDQYIRLINLDNLSGHNPAGPGFTGGEFSKNFLHNPGATITGGEVLSEPASWTSPTGDVWVFIGTANALYGYTVVAPVGGGLPVLTPQWAVAGSGETSPLVANGVVYWSSDQGLSAYNPTAGSLLWTAVPDQSGFHWQSPVVANGVVYCTDSSGNLAAYALTGTQPPPAFTALFGLDQNGYLVQGDNSVNIGTVPGVPAGNARAMALAPGTSQGYVADAFGNLHAFGGASAPTQISATWPQDLTRALLFRNGSITSGWVVDAYGGMHPFGGAPYIATSDYWYGKDLTRAAVVIPGTDTGYIIDAYGGMHPFGHAAFLPTSDYWYGKDLTRGAFMTNTTSGYIGDAYGGIHPFGNAPYVTMSDYWYGKDLARGLLRAPGAGGVAGYIPDTYGGFHSFGNVPPVTTGRYTYGRALVRNGAIS